MRRSLGSIREVSRGLYRVSVSAGRDDDGKRVRLDRTVRGGKRDAERELARMLIETGRVSHAARTMTLAEYLRDMYLPAIEPTVRARTFTGYESKLRVHVIPHLGGVQLADLGAYHIESWHAKLARAGVHPTTMLGAHRVLHVALRKAVAWRVIDRDPMSGIPAPTAANHEPTILTADELNALLDAAAGESIEPVVVLALAAGLRRSELCGLDWTDVDLERGEVRIRRGMHQRGRDVWYEPPKSATSRRDVSLPAWSIEALRPWRGIGPVVGDTKPDEVSKAFRRFLARHGLRDVPLRDLRHSHATLLLEQGVDLLVVSRRLGHASTAVSERFYLRVRRSADQAAADRFDGIRAPTRAKLT